MSGPRCLSRLIVCTGKDCRDEKGYRALVEMASAERGSVAAPCQGLCHGPIVGVQRGDEVRWYQKARSKSARKLLAAIVRADTPSSSRKATKRLADSEVRKRHNVVRGARRIKPLGAAH